MRYLFVRVHLCDFKIEFFFLREDRIRKLNRMVHADFFTQLNAGLFSYRQMIKSIQELREVRIIFRSISARRCSETRREAEDTIVLVHPREQSQIQGKKPFLIKRPIRTQKKVVKIFIPRFKRKS